MCMTISIMFTLSSDANDHRVRMGLRFAETRNPLCVLRLVTDCIDKGWSQLLCRLDGDLPRKAAWPFVKSCEP
jgi:hypothetical protein